MYFKLTVWQSCILYKQAANLLMTEMDIVYKTLWTIICLSEKNHLNLNFDYVFAP